MRKVASTAADSRARIRASLAASWAIAALRSVTSRDDSRISVVPAVLSSTSARAVVSSQRYEPSARRTRNSNVTTSPARHRRTESVTSRTSAGWTMRMPDRPSISSGS